MAHSCWGMLLILLAGCATVQPSLDLALMAEQGTAARNEGVAQAYRAGCPDVLELTTTTRPDLSGRYEIGPDGRIELGEIGRLRVEGLTPEEVARRVSQVTGLASSRVQVRVADFQSQQVYLIGEVVGRQRAVPYHGQETVLDLLKRVGGITAGAAPDNVYVVRSQVAEGGRPEVFHIDLQAVLTGRDVESNIRLQPFDQVFVGESRRSCLVKCMPPWLRPTCEALSGLRRSPTAPPPETAPGNSPNHTWAGRVTATGPTYRGTGD